MTALVSFVAGGKPTAAQWGTLPPIGTVKTSNENRISTSTLTDDAVLRADYNTNATYIMRAVVIHNSNSTADFKMIFADTGSASLFVCSCLCVPLGGTSTGMSFTPGGSGTVFIGEGGSADRPMWFEGVLVIGGTPGALKIAWAQNTSTASTTSVQAGSFLSLTQVA